MTHDKIFKSYPPPVSGRVSRCVVPHLLVICSSVIYLPYRSLGPFTTKFFYLSHCGISRRRHLILRRNHLTSVFPRPSTTVISAPCVYCRSPVASLPGLCPSHGVRVPCVLFHPTRTVVGGNDRYSSSRSVTLG